MNKLGAALLAAMLALAATPAPAQINDYLKECSLKFGMKACLDKFTRETIRRERSQPPAPPPVPTPRPKPREWEI